MIARRRPRHGVPVRRQGLLYLARYALESAAQRAGELRDHRGQSRSETAGISRRRAAAIISQSLGVRYRIIEQNTYAVVKRVIPEGKTMCGLCSRLRRGALYRYRRRKRHHQDRPRPPPRRHRRDVVLEHVLRRQVEGDAAEAAERRPASHRHPAAVPIVPERLIARYAAARAFPIIPCTLCGVAAELAAHRGEKHAARLGTGVSRPHRGDLLQHLATSSGSQLADPALFDFAGLDGRPPDRADDGRGRGCGSPRNWRWGLLEVSSATGPNAEPLPGKGCRTISC